MDLKALQQLALDFRNARDWKQFHSPENLAKSTSIEAAELLECFQWNPEYNQDDVAGEVADILTYLLLISDACNIDLEQAFIEKLSVSSAKYPIEKSRGVSTKYDKL